MTLKLANSISVVAALIAVLLYGGYPVVDLLLIVDSLLIVWGVTHYALAKITRGSTHTYSEMTIGLLVFFWVAYTVKMPMAIFFPELFWVVPSLINSSEFRKQIPFAFLIASVGYSVMIVSIISSRSSIPICWEINRFKPKLFYMVFISIFALFTKYIMKEYFHLGVPTVEPISLGVPMLTGFVALLIDVGYFIIVNLFLFSAFYTARGWLVALGLFFVFTNAGIDLLYGSKDSIMYQVVVTLSYIYIFRKFSPADRIKKTRFWLNSALIVTVCLGTFAVVFYKYFNMYRYARFTSGMDVSTAIDIIMLNKESIVATSISELWNRISGIEVLSAVIYWSDLFSRSYGLMEIATGTIASEFTYLIIGTEERNVKFGVTQFGYFYIAAGFFGLIAGFFLVARFFVLLQKLVIISNVDYHAKIAFFPVLWILMVKIMLGGGNFSLIFKEFFMALLIFWISAKILLGRMRTGQSSLETGRLQDAA